MLIKLGFGIRGVVSREIDLSSHPQGGFNLDEAAIARYIATTFEGVDVVVASSENGALEIAWSDSFFIYDPDRNLVEANEIAVQRVERRKIPSDGRS